MDNRYFFSVINDNLVTITEQEFQHLAKVRRAKVADIIVGFNGDGFDYELEIETINKTSAECKILSKISNKANERPNISVYLASIKNEALEEALDNLTQLNIKDIYIFTSQYTNVKYDNNKKQKLNMRFIQYCKQCERADIPNLNFISFDEMLNQTKTKDYVIFAYEKAQDNFLKINFSDLKNKNIALIVGGEGGFSNEEAEKLKSFCTTVSLGKTILRAPVAVTALTSAILANLGDWQR